MVGRNFICRICRIDNQGTVKTKRLRPIGIGMRMVEIGTVLLGREFVAVGRVGWECCLGDLWGWTVHLVLQNDPMPVHRRTLRQPVGDVDAHMVALTDVDARSWNLVVLRISIDGHPRLHGERLSKAIMT